MNCSISAKLELVQLGFLSLRDAKPYNKRLISESIYWICQEIDNDLETQNHPNKSYCKEELVFISELANASFKDDLSPDQIQQMLVVCVRVGMCSIDGPEADISS
jgi:squalene cyclase